MVGKTACGKTGFVQRLGVNKFFGDIIKAEWVSYIKLDKKREAEIQSCFDCQLDFYYPRNKEHFGNLLEYFKTKSSSSDENLDENDAHPDQIDDVDVNYSKGYDEKSKRNRLIVMDDVSGLADSSAKFASFLTVARKFKYHCLYIIHTIHPEKSIWKTILSETNLLNIFPASVPTGTVKKILGANCIRRTTKYIPVNSLWITKLFIQLANNESENTCLTIDCTGFNSNGPGRFRTDAADPDSQTCFFNRADEDSLFNVFVGKRIKDEPNQLLFKIEGLKTQADNETYNASSELENLKGNGLSNVRVRESTDVISTGYGNREQFPKYRSRSKWKSAKPRFLPG